MKQADTKERGFTLIELSMVLVIIALIVGGVLAGRELIHGAKLRKVASDIQRFTTAVNTFKIKYNGLPGDITNASSMISGATNGNGNGFIGGFTAQEGEMFQAWYQMAQAGMLSGNFTGVGGENPRHSVPGVNIPAYSVDGSAGYTLMYWAGLDGSAASFQAYPAGTPPLTTTINSHVFELGVSAGYETYYPGVTTQDAFTIDSKMDDGKPGTGKVIAINMGMNWACPNDKNQYQTTDYRIAGAWEDAKFCDLTFIAQF